jgi:uncharacterized OsmC-like protein
MVGQPVLSADGMTFTFSARASSIPGEHMLKVGWFGEHEVYCDESAAIGGEDEYAPPLGYLGLALGFCTLTQLMRIVQLRHLDVERAECLVEMDWWSTGSLVTGTARTGCREVRTRIAIESSESAATIAEVVRQAEAGCYVNNLVQTVTPTRSSLELNGEEIVPAA